MLVYPVLDVKGGLVVHGIAGERDTYRPIESVLVDSARPLDVARAFRDRLGLTRLYVADLDALGGADAAIGLYSSLIDAGFELLVDAGLRSGCDAGKLRAAGVQSIVAALESHPAIECVRTLQMDLAGNGRVEVRMSIEAWGMAHPES